MSPYEQMARAFHIFAQYPGEQGVTFHHDEAYAGPDPAVVTAEHLVELKELGWAAIDGQECFYTLNRC